MRAEILHRIDVIVLNNILQSTHTAAFRRAEAKSIDIDI